MITKSDIIDAAFHHGFDDVGFTTVEPFDTHKAYLLAHQDEYGWAEATGLQLISGTDPRTILPDAQTIIVLIEVYFKATYPPVMERHFGRYYLDDDRVTKDGLARRIHAFRGFLLESGIQSKVPFNLPHRSAAMRAGLGTVGSNCLFYSNRVARQSSWNLPIAVVIDRAFDPDTPTVGTGCPDWCRHACIAACPTRALKGNGTIDPGACISYLSYFGKGITPAVLREPMGMNVYGCDRCQDVCPRNTAWLAKALPVNERAAAKAGDFDLVKLLHMDKAFFEARIWPHMFYMPSDDIWRWKMNVARAMGNSLDAAYADDLIRAYDENEDARVRGMIAWALGRIGGQRCRMALERLAASTTGAVADEVSAALRTCSENDRRGKG